MAKRAPLSLDLTPPAGLIRFKYSDFVFNDAFPEFGLVGPMACIAGESRLYDARTRSHIPIQDMAEGDYAPLVLAWDGTRFVEAKATVPFLKGHADLYRVRLANGQEIVTTLQHRFLTEAGWRTLGAIRLALSSGTPIGLLAAPALQASSSGASPSASQRGALRSTRTTPGWLGRYWMGHRRCDAPPRLAPVPAPASPPSPGCAPARSRSWGWPWGALGAPRDGSLGSPSPLQPSDGSVLLGARLSAGPRFPRVAYTFATPAACPQVQVRLESRGLQALLRRGLRWLRGGRRSGIDPWLACGEFIRVDSVEYERSDCFYDLHVPGLENYLAEGIVNHNTAKSSAAVDRLGRRALEYPGLNQLLARGTLTSLKDSTIVRLRQRLGPLFAQANGGNENLQEGVFRTPPAPHPVTGQPVQSSIVGIGLDRADLENVLKSTEWGGGHLEEANEIPSAAHDLFQERCRQEIWHRSRTVRDMCMDLVATWSKYTDKPLTWVDVYNILLDDPLNRIGERQLPHDHPEPGATVVTATWNPVGNDHTWQRYVGVPYPFPAPDEKWVEANVGIREVHVDPKILREDRHHFRAGALVRLRDGKRGYVARHDYENNVVKLVGGESYPDDQVGLIVQRYTIYAFGHENMSRDHRNVENTYLMADQEVRRKHQLGHVDVREGRVTPAYIDEPLEFGGHLLPEIPRERIARSGNLIIGGLDHGGDHPTAIVLAMYLPKSGTTIVFDELVQSGNSAYANATVLNQMVVPGLEHVIGYDPAMNAKTYDRDADRRIIDNYIEVLGDRFVPGTAGPVAFDDLAKLVEFQDSFLDQRGAMPRLLVTENCVQVRKTLLELEWRMVRRQRNNWRVDVGDALKLMASLVRRGYGDMARFSDVTFTMAPRAAYSNSWKDGQPVEGSRHVAEFLE